MAARRPLILVVGVVLVLAGAGCAAGQAAQGPSGIHVSYGEDASSSMTVAWLGPPQGEAHVEYGPTEGYGQTKQASSLLPAASERASYVAEIDGLEPNTTYHYRAVTGGQASGDHTFTTAPEPGTDAPVRITAFADHGAEHPRNRGDGDAPVRNVKLAASLDPTLHLVAGDLSYAEGDGTQWNLYADQIQPLAGEVPYMTVAGNHEREAGQGFHQYDARFPMPTPEAEDERWWTLQHGNVLVVGMNSERACQAPAPSQAATEGDPADDCETDQDTQPYEPQLAFVRQALASAAEDVSIDWTILLTHHPFWSSSAHGSAAGLQEHYLPVVDEHGVDLVVQGHDHVYERTEILADGDLAEEGTVYVTNGAGGSGFYGFDDPKPDWSAVRDNEHYGTLLLEITGDRLHGSFVSLDGETVDAFTLENAPEGGVREPATGTGDGTGAVADGAGGPVPTSAGLAVAALLVATLAAARRR